MIWVFFFLFLKKKNGTVVPLYVATLARGHLYYEAMISENTFYIFESKISITRGHSSNKARFSIPQGWPYKRGTTVVVFLVLPVNTTIVRYRRKKLFKRLAVSHLLDRKQMFLMVGLNLKKDNIPVL